MAQRTVALCDGKFVGIESIFTVVDGKQINIPEKLSALRLKSRKNELFCPCGCGSNLILVASENNLREQHFRLKNSEFNKKCQAVTEGKRSVDSKIVLKCWLDEKLGDGELESRVPIADVSDTNRRFEFTFLSKVYSIGISYCHDRVNISNEKLKHLADHSAYISLVHILDACNFRADGQYPEAEMKIQNLQGFCLLLDINDKLDYYKADMRAVFYAQNLDGLWEEISICDSKLSNYAFDRGMLTCNGVAITGLAIRAKKEYAAKLEAEREERVLARKQREAYEREKRSLAEKRRLEFLKQKEEQRIEVEKSAEKDDMEYVKNNIDQQNKPVVDSKGVRWIRCEFCKKIATDSEFTSYGGANHINLGTCKACRANNPKAQISRKMISSNKPAMSKRDPNECPRCGGKIVEKIGRYGRFRSCSNFPRCDYKPLKW